MSRATVWTPEKERRARKLHVMGMTYEEIAESVGLSRGAVEHKFHPRPDTRNEWPKYVPIVPLRMIVSPWFIDPADGVKTRIVRAAE